MVAESAENEQMMLNELRRLERAINARRKVIEDMGKKPTLSVTPRRYVLDFAFKAPASAAALPPVTRSVVIDREAPVFYCKEMTYAVTAQGTLSVTSVGARITISPHLRDIIFPFTYKVRDSATDREWQNLPLPSTALGGGWVGGMPLSKKAMLPAGTELSCEVNPLVAATSVASVFSSIASYTVQITFVGFEVR